MQYKMEELVPIVAELAKKYTANESTSITYEKAEQLMEAVLYCIREADQDEAYAVISAENVTAYQAYKAGAARVWEKTKRTLEAYNRMLPEFCDYGNRCLSDTFLKGLPAFFKWYNVEFDPQNTILTLDYPVLKDLSAYTGIDRIAEYIRCIRLEQKFLRLFSEEYVIHLLSRYDVRYRDMIENLCEIVLLEMLSASEAQNQLKKTAEGLVKQLESTDKELATYLTNIIRGTIIRLQASSARKDIPIDKVGK